MKTVVFAPAALKQLDSLPFTARSAIEAGLDRPALEGRGDVKKLQGRDGFRLCVGEYRVIYQETPATILVLAVGRRQTSTYS